MKRIVFNVSKDHINSVISQRKLGIKKRRHGRNPVPEVGEIDWVRLTGGGRDKYGLHSEVMITFVEEVIEGTYRPSEWKGEYTHILDYIITRRFSKLICEKFDSQGYSTVIPELYRADLTGSTCVVKDSNLLGYLNLINKQEQATQEMIGK